MRLERLEVVDFRNHDRASMELDGCYTPTT